MSRPWVAAAVMIVIETSGTKALAFTPLVMSNGASIRWRQPITINIAGNPENSNSLTASDFFKSATTSLQRWKAASQGSVDFNYWQGTDRSKFPTSGGNDGLSSLFFLSQMTTDNSMSSSIIGTTQVWYDGNSGDIYEADIILNDRNFNFTTSPEDSTEPAEGVVISRANHKIPVYIENTISHELGHTLGLSHTGGLGTSMLFMEAPDQAFLSCDEKVGIQSLYPTSQTDLTGAFHGTVTANGSPVFGAHVVAISETRGTFLASALTDRSGSFHFGHLEPGNYFLMIEPYYAGAQTLPNYYSSMNFSVCSGREFKKTFFTTNSEQRPAALRKIPVNSGVDSDLGSISVKCSPIPVTSPSPSQNPQFDMSTANGRTGDFAWVDVFPQNSQRRSYPLRNVSGDLVIRVVSYSLYSPVKAILSLTNSMGNPVNFTYVNPNYKSSDFTANSGFQSFDGILTAPSLAPGDYTLSISTQSVPLSSYPAGYFSVDRNFPFVVVFGSTRTESDSINSNSTLPDNPRCRSLENFARYQSPSNPPLHRSLPGANPTTQTGACGRIKTSSTLQRGSSEPPFGAAVGWLIPWLFALGGLRVSNSLHRPKLAIKLKK